MEVVCCGGDGGGCCGGRTMCSFDEWITLHKPARHAVKHVSSRLPLGLSSEVGNFPSSGPEERIIHRGRTVQMETTVWSCFPAPLFSLEWGPVLRTCFFIVACGGGSGQKAWSLGGNVGVQVDTSCLTSLQRLGAFWLLEGDLRLVPVN